MTLCSWPGEVAIEPFDPSERSDLQRGESLQCSALALISHASPPAPQRIEKCEEQAGVRPGEVLADAGCWSEENAKLESEETELFIATTKDWKQRNAMREASPPRGRIPKGLLARDRMERKLLTKQGREAYKQRGSTIEPVFGQMVM